MDDFLGELDEDVEGMQSTIYILQQQLKEAREEVSRLQTEVQQLHKSQQTNASASLSVNTDSTTTKSGVVSQDSTRTSMPTSSNLNDPETVQVKMEPDENQVQNYNYRASREKFNPPTSNGQKSSPEAHNLDSAEDVDKKLGSPGLDYATGIQSYQTSKNSNFRLVNYDHEANNETNDNNKDKATTKTPRCIESTGTPSGDDWSPKPVKISGDIEGEESDITMDKEGGIDASRTGLLDRDTAVPINGLETSPSYSSHEET
jgi:chromosome segregation ATPase